MKLRKPPVATGIASAATAVHVDSATDGGVVFLKLQRRRPDKSLVWQTFAELTPIEAKHFSKELAAAARAASGATAAGTERR